MTKKELIAVTKKRYLKADRKNKGKMLDEFCGNVGYNRNYANLQNKCPNRWGQTYIFK